MRTSSLSVNCATTRRASSLAPEDAATVQIMNRGAMQAQLPHLRDPPIEFPTGKLHITLTRTFTERTDNLLWHLASFSLRLGIWSPPCHNRHWSTPATNRARSMSTTRPTKQIRTSGYRFSEKIMLKKQQDKMDDDVREKSHPSKAPSLLRSPKPPPSCGLSAPSSTHRVRGRGAGSAPLLSPNHSVASTPLLARDPRSFSMLKMGYLLIKKLRCAGNTENTALIPKKVDGNSPATPIGDHGAVQFEYDD